MGDVLAVLNEAAAWLEGRGVEQWPLSGVSMKYTFDAKPDDPETDEPE